MRYGTSIFFAWLISLSIAGIHYSAPKNVQTQTVKITDTIGLSPLRDTHWKLTELDGKAISDTATNKEMYVLLKSADSRVEGDGGCNAFSGSYTLQGNNRITFGQMISTKMWCKGLEYETAFFKALSSADHYYIQANTLSLTKGKLKRVAKFEAVK